MFCHPFGAGWAERCTEQSGAVRSATLERPGAARSDLEQARGKPRAARSGVEQPGAALAQSGTG
eukprot:2031698-Alexandrium_andersonii.AAC.1